VLPIAPRFNPICFAQSPPLLTYLCGTKGMAFHISIESSILESLNSFNIFFAIGINYAKKKTVGLVMPPQLINMKHNKYRQFSIVIFDQ
jgi:hypothetical protein